MSINKTQIMLQIHKGAIRLFETGKFNQESALKESIRMMKETAEEVLGHEVAGLANLPDPMDI